MYFLGVSAEVELAKGLGDKVRLLLFLRVVGGQPSFRMHADKYVVGMRRQVSCLLDIAVAPFFPEITARERAQIPLDIRRFGRNNRALHADILVRRRFRLRTETESASAREQSPLPGVPARPAATALSQLIRL